MEVQFGSHALLRMAQRGISREVVMGILGQPDDLRVAADEHSNNHYLGRVAELGGDVVTVVLDPYKQPGKVVTVTRDDPGG